MITKDFATGMFVGGILALMIMGILLIWDNAVSLAPFMWILILDVILVVDIFIDKIKEVNKKRRLKKND